MHMRRMLALMLTGCLSLTSLAGCQSQSDNTAAEAESQDAAATTEDAATATSAESDATGTSASLKDDPAEAERQITIAMQNLLDETFGGKIYDARIYVDKIYSTEEEQADETLAAYNLGPDEVAFEVHYELLPTEDADPNELTAATGVYDEESGWVKEKYNVGILRPSGLDAPSYVITDFGTAF